MKTPAIGSEIPTLDDLPPGSTAMSLHECDDLEDDVVVRFPEGALVGATAAPGPWRVLATGLPWGVCSALSRVECCIMRSDLALAIGAYRPQPEPAVLPEHRPDDPAVSPSWMTGWWLAWTALCSVEALRLAGVLPPQVGESTAGGYLMATGIFLALACGEIARAKARSPLVAADLAGRVVMVLIFEALILAAMWATGDLYGLPYVAAMLPLFLMTVLGAAFAALPVERALRRRWLAP